ncbi:zinc-binding dehydrogenase [Pseudomonas fluorescens]|nr:zinc-binding dehydrogenase [Pseudomonas fluorescens]
MGIGQERTFAKDRFCPVTKIRPVIDQVYPIEKAREAYEHLARGAFGKVVIKVA